MSQVPFEHQKQKVITFSDSLTREHHPWCTSWHTIVKTRTQDLRHWSLTLYQLEQLSYNINWKIYILYHNIHIMHIILHITIKHILHILHILRANTYTSVSQFIDIIAWFPIPGPSYLRTTTYIHHHCSLICRMMLRESLLILVAWQRVLSRLHPPGLEEGVPEWRILESHTRLVLAHGARRSLQIDTVQPTLWFTNNSEYA